jgi:hypothetical protein
MKNNQILAALTGVFFLCSLVTFYRVWNYHSSLRRFGETQARAVYVKSVEGPVMNSLLNDTIEYSKKNPAVAPILQALTNNMGRTPASAAKPAAK